MKRIVFITALLLILFLAVPKTAVAQVADASASLKFGDLLVKFKAEDERITQLKQYLQSHNSPLAPYADVFVKKADLYGLPDWKLVPAISGVESTFGKRIPYNSYNAYGWANGAYAFKNWEESIDIVTKTLKQKYYDRGADTVEEIARIYAPPSNTWARNVNFFMGKIADYTPALQTKLKLSI